MGACESASSSERYFLGGFLNFAGFSLGFPKVGGGDRDLDLDLEVSLIFPTKERGGDLDRDLDLMLGGEGDTDREVERDFGFLNFFFCLLTGGDGDLDLCSTGLGGREGRGRGLGAARGAGTGDGTMAGAGAGESSSCGGGATGARGSTSTGAGSL